MSGGKTHWAYLLTKVCTKKSIVDASLTKAEEVILAALRRIFKAENINFDTCFNRMFTFYWLRTSTNVDFLYSQILGEDVRVESENIAPSLTYLFVSYYEKYLKEGASEVEKSAPEEVRDSIGGRRSAFTGNNVLKRKAPSDGYEQRGDEKRQKPFDEYIVSSNDTTTSLTDYSHLPTFALPVPRHTNSIYSITFLIMPL